MQPGIFLSPSTFNADTLRCVHIPPCALARIYICVHVKDPVVHVRVRWIMETLKHPVCTVGWVARLCRSWLSPGKATGISHGRNPRGTIQKKKKKKRKELFLLPLLTPPKATLGSCREVGCSADGFLSGIHHKMIEAQTSVMMICRSEGGTPCYAW